jgi:hypothetical protein
MLPLQPFLDKLLPVLRACVTGRYAIALAGAHAKGHWDEGSDLDLFLLADALKPAQERAAVVSAAGGRDVYITPTLDEHPWGGSIDFRFNDMPVETTVRSIERMQCVVAACAAGQFTVTPVLWTIHGYYDFVYLSEAAFLQPIADPQAIFPALKAQVDPYPEAFRKAALAYFLPRAGYWMESFHYLSAIQRGDFVYTSGILQQSFHNLLQALFPLNRRFFNGDKRIPHQLASLPFCPQLLREKLDFLLSAPREPAKLRRQREEFMQVLAEVNAAVRFGA